MVDKIVGKKHQKWDEAVWPEFLNQTVPLTVKNQLNRVARLQGKVTGPIFGYTK